MNNFDFLVGEWTVANRRLRERLVDSDEWEEFESSSVAWNLLDGAAQIDQFTFPDGATALTLRLLDPQRQEWSLRWAASSDGVLLPPVIGRFTDGVGTFYGDDEHRGHAGSGALRVVGDHRQLGPLGTGLLRRR